MLSPHTHRWASRAIAASRSLVSLVLVLCGISLLLVLVRAPELLTAVSVGGLGAMVLRLAAESLYPTVD